jgi:hypothetical protein
VYTQNQQNYVYKLFLPRCKLLCSAVVLQYGAHVITAWGRCETVQKQQSGIPDRPVFMHKYAVKLQTVATGVVATDTNNKRLKRINFDNFVSKLR